jgi:virulence-associated protein VagC
MLLGAVAVPVDLRLSVAEQRTIVEGTIALVDAPLSEQSDAARVLAGVLERVVRQARHDLDATAAVIRMSGTNAAPSHSS